MITYSHKIGEQFTFITEAKDAANYVIYRASDGKYFNTLTRSFDSPDLVSPESISNYLNPLKNHPATSNLKTSKVTFLPRQPLDLIFEVRTLTGESLSFERHLLGGYSEPNKPGICVIFGTLYNPSGAPIVGARVDANLNRSGYYIDKHPVISPASSAITDERGYFELPLIQGINVTISIPSTGFTTGGFVPKQQSLELSGYCLLREER